jgi:hypothetical protein
MNERLDQDPRYRRLPACRRPLLGSASYWLGPDHLLIVDSMGVLERYRKVRYPDIETVLIQPNRIRAIGAGVIGIILVFLLAGGGVGSFFILREPDSNLLPLLGLIGLLIALPVALLLWWIIPGTFCQTRLRTSVQDVRLPGLYRLGTARQFANALHAAAIAHAGKIPVPVADSSNPPADPQPAPPESAPAPATPAASAGPDASDPPA